MTLGTSFDDGVNTPVDFAWTEVDVRIRRLTRTATDDLFLPEAERLDDRTRAAIGALLAWIVAGAEAEVRRHAARLLAGYGATEAAERVLIGGPVLARLVRAGSLRDPELMEEVIARVRLDLIAERLPITMIEPGRPSLLVRWSDSADQAVADAALASLVADNRRRDVGNLAGPIGSELPTELQRRLFWWIAAAVREQEAAPAGMADRDRALTAATLQALSTHNEEARSEPAAARLADAVDPPADMLAPLLLEALGDRRLILFVALVARAAGIDYEQVRHLVIDPHGELLIPLLHAIGIDRDPIARIAVALADADPRRDLGRMADAIDAVVKLDPAAIRARIAPLALGRSFRLAVRALT